MKSVIMKSIIGASRGGILGLQTQIVEKKNEALTNYIQELKDVKETFEANKDDPPLLENHPETAGRIWWMKSLFHRIKKPIVELKKDEDVINTDPGQQALQDYLALAKEMRDYGDQLYDVWSENAGKALPTNLRENVLISVPATVEDLGRNYAVCKNKNVYKVNVPAGILEMVQEAQLLEEMGGYRISESLRTVSLQQSQYTKNILALQTIVEKYYKLRLELRPPETQLCDKLFQEMDKHFEQGATHWNWAALALADYANTLSAAVAHFGGVVSQINKIGRDVRFRVLEMKNVILFKEPPYKTASYDLPIFDCWDYFQYWEKHRAKIWQKLLLHYRGLPPLFLKLETLTQNTSTGKHPSFRHYFARWEKFMFQYVGKFVIRSLYVHEKRLLHNEPLFYVEAVLHSREIRLNPPPHEIFNLVMKGARDYVEGPICMKLASAIGNIVVMIRANFGENPPNAFEDTHEKVQRCQKLVSKVENTGAPNAHNILLIICAKFD